MAQMGNRTHPPNSDRYGSGEWFGERKRKGNKLDVFDFDEFDCMDVEMRRCRRFDDNKVCLEGKRFMGAMHITISGIDKEFYICWRVLQGTLR